LTDILTAAQQYLTRWLLSWEDEFFGFLYYDVSDFASSNAPRIFSQGRSISIYGVRGIGKTAAMQGILWHGMKNANASQSGTKNSFLPVSVSVKGMRGASSVAELEERFYRSVLSGLLLSTNMSSKYERAKHLTANFAPWISKKAVDAASLVFPPAFIGSDAVERGVKKLLDRLGIKEQEKLVISKDVDARFATDFILKEVEVSNVIPVFAIDELDKVPYDALLSDFFDGNQEFFQGRRTIISLSHTFGESVQKALVVSVSRFSSVQSLGGVDTPEDLSKMLEPRLALGLSQTAKTSKEANALAESLFRPETIETIVNLYVPNAHLMLEAAYRGVENASRTKSSAVFPEHVEEHASGSRVREAPVPTELQRLILGKLSLGRLSPSEIAERTDRKEESVVRILKMMMKNNWVGRVGEGRRVYYFLTQGGEAARRHVLN